ncbi:MAG TPA: aldo/keto reductase [Casimicrobiaceae bacterium]|nr:aldo/keto reductase [Casimicrobiaceae bacterium]
MPRPIPRLTLPNGASMPALGLGTWRMGERSRDRGKEIAALRLGLDLGMTLIDTAEMYADGGAEEVVGEAIAGRRDEVFLVSKVYPHHASRKGVAAACERSLKRLGTDRLDLYLLHWRGRVPLAETVTGFEALRASGKIRAWGVSNFDRAGMEELHALPGGRHCAANQVLYHLRCRGIEWDLLPLCRQLGINVMAYSPFDEGRLLGNRKLASIARKYKTKPATLALAWLLAQDHVAAIPKAADVSHVRDNLAAVELSLSAELLRELDRAFPAPKGPAPLQVI